MDSLEVDDNHHANIVNRIVIQSRRYVFRSLKTHKTTATRVFLLALFVLYFVYFGFAISYGWNSTYSYCDGVKFLFILTVLVASGLIYFQIIKRFFGEVLTKEFINPLTEVISELWERWFVRWQVLMSF